ncbi:PaaI family thioesterase [Actinomadura parmotrematis]|uniref:PaaI family thioesterase n=1 Tax=Actinomadura parmotrematis TaxID=2864039 RepID=A0ABS7FRA0_9ACTN|nr:PaaI family thioesterase [Actinomadura parmotrematis]MBW8482048.1 PaaI family thioesterase [Actinomadura parmotrematis]
MTDLSPAVPGGFVPAERGSPVLDALGGFLRHRDDPLRFGFAVTGPKLNRRGLLHGGVIATLGDVVIGRVLATLTDPPVPLVTVNLACDLVGSAREGDWVEIVVSPTKTGRRLRAGGATFANGRVVATVSGLFLPVA